MKSISTAQNKSLTKEGAKQGRIDNKKSIIKSRSSNLTPDAVPDLLEQLLAGALLNICISNK